MMDEHTRLDSVSAEPGRILVYKFTLVRNAAHEMDPTELNSILAEQRQEIVQTSLVAG